MVHFGVIYPSTIRDTCGPTMVYIGYILNLVKIAPCLLSLDRAGCHLLTLVWADHLIIVGRGSGAAFICGGRGRGCY